MSKMTVNKSVNEITNESGCSSASLPSHGHTHTCSRGQGVEVHSAHTAKPEPYVSSSSTGLSSRPTVG